MSELTWKRSPEPAGLVSGDGRAQGHGMCPPPMTIAPSLTQSTFSEGKFHLVKISLCSGAMKFSPCLHTFSCLAGLAPK